MINKVTLLGRLGKNPEVKTVGGDKSVAKLSVATTESYKDAQGQKVEKTEWHNVVIWGKGAEIAGKYLAKGDQVYLEGKIKTRSYEVEGQKRYATEIVADEFKMLGNNRNAGNNAPAEVAEVADGNLDDVPFLN